MKNQDSKDKNDFLIIPNPIYDVVFRYLMQDYDSALIILSTLIGEEIKKLDFQPLTHAIKKTEEENLSQKEKQINKRFEKEKKKILGDNSLSDIDKQIKISEITIKDPVTNQDIKLFHLDFVAIIEKENGEIEQVMIELQKVAVETDIFRFKQYIAENFQKKRKVKITDPDTGQEITEDYPYRLIPIFILNFEIEYEITDLMIRTRQIKTGIFTGKELDKKNKFIDHLSYELYVVQLPYLNKIDKSLIEDDEYRSKLYALLKLFDQEAKKEDNEYRLRLFRKIFPKFLDRIIKRLQTADIDNPDLEKQMQAEDNYLKPLLRRDNKIAWFKLNKKQIEEKLENTTKKLENTTEKLEKELKVSKEKDKALGEKDTMIIELAKTLKENNIPIEIIIEKTKLSKEEIDKL